MSKGNGKRKPPPRVIAVDAPAPLPEANPDAKGGECISNDTVRRFVATAWLLGEKVGPRFVTDKPDEMADAVIKMQTTIGIVRITVDKEEVTRRVDRVDDLRAPFFGLPEVKGAK